MARSCKHLLLQKLIATLLIFINIWLLIRPSTCDFAEDRAECADKLVGLSACLTYVQASGGAMAPKPTPECCSGFNEVVTKSLKCVCVLIKDRNAPGLGFKVDVQRALTLPPKCNVLTNVSDCPRLLDLSSNSPQAKEFLQFANELKNGTRTKSASVNVKGNTVDTPSNDGWKKIMGLDLELRCVLENGFVSLLFFSILISMYSSIFLYFNFQFNNGSW
ncbi:non-specific lipid transfer protein GPI-anchored 6-like [Dioscorea cayenensis subsp. rotundata]|uniref:Non-specific lipid transfer protein GPI-anchored 6-like n=1 Tax=Dioscorea cayennensis subsp. rotundata TaxID=55577 RepID=A0AB40BS14_DIOCR|nr:non-specific lipid transfer protein GPI-anchored 6-like [Dioscorea cayenensis subsp. rotundata]